MTSFLREEGENWQTRKAYDEVFGRIIPSELNLAMLRAIAGQLPSRAAISLSQAPGVFKTL